MDRKRLAGLVRNSDGTPRFKDYSNIDPVFTPHLTEKDWEYIRAKQRESVKNGDASRHR